MALNLHNPNCPSSPHAVCPPAPQRIRATPIPPGEGNRPAPPITNGNGRPVRPVIPTPGNGNGRPVAPEPQLIPRTPRQGEPEEGGGGAFRPVAPLITGNGEELPAPTVESLLREAIEEIRLLRQAVIEPPVPIATSPEIKLVVVEVVTAGTAVEIAELRIPPGSLVTFRQRQHTTSRTGYISFEGRSGPANSRARHEMNNNDSVTHRLSNLRDIWFDASANNTFFEVFYRQSRWLEL